MDGRELIKKVIDFDDAERIGYAFGEGYPNDFASFGAAGREGFDYGWHEAKDFAGRYPGLASFNGQARKDEFGNIWARMAGDSLSKGEVLYGALGEWSDLEGYSFPNLSDPKRFAHIEQSAQKYLSKFKLGGLPGFPFDIMRYMRKLEYFLEDLLLERENVLKLGETVVGELLKIIDNYGDLGMDAVMFAEDWGTQDRLMISPELWREIFKPSFQKLCDRAHGKNMYVFMHSCGYIYEILEDLIEVGVNVFNFDQSALMGTERVAGIFHKRATLFAPVDIQTILPTGDRARIEGEAKDLIRKFFHGGGFIAKDYHSASIQVKEEWSVWMRDAFIAHAKNQSRIF